MLKLRRSGTPIPRLLSSDEVREARLSIVQYLRLPSDQRERRRPPLSERLYRNPQVVSSLRALHRDKCAYCEVAIPLGEEQVEHFRPLGYATGLDGVENGEHYVWLAYEWENLLLACVDCAKAKGSYFPVSGLRGRFRAPLDELFRNERPEVLDPCRDQPWTEIRFHANGTCRHVRRKGEVTIAVLQLNRPSLVRRRARDFQELRARLRDAVLGQNREQLSLLFDLSREFVGGRLDVLHSALTRWADHNTIVPAVRETLPGWFERAVADAVPAARERLLFCFDQVYDEDARLAGDTSATTIDDLAIGGTHVPLPPVLGSGRRYPDREIRLIEISDFKGIEHLSLEIARRGERRRDLPCLMLLGENSAGKSTVLEAVALALAGTSAAKRLKLPGSDLLRRDDPDSWDLVDPPAPRVVVHFREEAEPAVFTVSRDGRQFEGTAQPSVQVLAYGARRHFSDKAPVVREPFDLIRNLFDADRAMPSAEPWLLRMSEDPKIFNAIARALREVLALDETDELILDRDRVAVRVLGRPIPVERLSEGYRCLFSLAVDIIRNLLMSWPDLERARAVVLIDEIETHLHPRWKMRIVSALRRAFPAVQFIVTTHDPLCIRGMDDGEVEVIERDRMGRVHRLDDLPSVRGMRAEQLLTSDYFGLFSTADAELEFDLARVADGDGTFFPATDRAQDGELISRIVLGDTMKQQLIHEALDRYLEEREQRRGQGRARKEAITAVLDVLRSDTDRSAS